jgi:hypothetical protein
MLFKEIIAVYSEKDTKRMYKYIGDLFVSATKILTIGHCRSFLSLCCFTKSTSSK